MAKIKFSDIHVGAFVKFNDCYACKTTKTELLYRENGIEQVKEFGEHEEIEIEENNDNTKS